MSFGRISRRQLVLTDYVAMEAHNGDTLTSIYKSMGILCEFPKQVVILKRALST